MLKGKKWLIIIPIMILVCFTVGFTLKLTTPKTVYRVYLKGQSIGIIRSKQALEDYIDKNGNAIDATYDLYIRYTVDGKKYEAILRKKSGFNEGDRINIFYNPNNLDAFL